MEPTPLWWREGIIYQIYPRSFADSNGDGIGDLPGIISHLDYLADLGVDAIWLSPIYPSPDVDFGYDISDYLSVDPRYGTLEDFANLVREAHQRRIRVVMDMVFNHTSDQHPWFQASRASRDNPYRDWYLWRPPSRGGRPNNWQSVFGGPGWQLDPLTGEYYFHMFYRQQPDLNWRNPAVRETMLGVLRTWLERGVDGFRLDVFNACFKDAGLADNPPAFGLRGFERQRHVHDIDQPELYGFLSELRALLDSYPGTYAVGETFLATPQKAAGYCGTGRLHQAFNFKFTEAHWNPRQYRRAIAEWESALGPQNWPNYVLGNHDVPRLANRLLDGRSPALLGVAAALLLSLRGTPFLYYGDEIGMRDIRLRRSQILDPVGRRYWPIFPGRDGCRSPMQWDDIAGAGFSRGKPWLPIHPNAVRTNVAAQANDPASLLSFYRRLIAARRATPALHSGEQRLLPSTPSTLAIERRLGNQRVLVLLNFTGLPAEILLEEQELAYHWRLLVSNQRSNGPEITIRDLHLKPGEALLLVSE